jgi:putative MATE family efflux protein
MPRSRRALDIEISHLAVPALGSLAIDPLTSMLDTLFVGQLGKTPLAALGAALGIFNFGFFVFNFLATAITPLVAGAMARNDKADAGHLIGLGLITAFGIGLGITAIIEIFAEQILALMGAHGRLAEQALGYVRIRAAAAPAVLLITAGFGSMRGLFDTKTPFLIAIGLNAINAILDPIFIFVFDWGVAGAGAATLVAQWAAVVAMMWTLFRRASRRHGVRISRPHFNHVRELFTTGAPLALRTAMLLFVLNGARAVATRLGQTAIAGYQIAYQVWELFALIVDALAVAAQVLVAHHLGQGRVDLARRAANRVLFWGLASGVLLGVLSFAFRNPIASVFTTDPQIARTAGYLIVFVALSQPINAVVFVWDGVFMGARDNGYLAWGMAAASVVGGVLLWLVLPLGWGIGGVWSAIVIFLTARAVTLGVRYIFRGGPLGGQVARTG